MNLEVNIPAHITARNKMDDNGYRPQWAQEVLGTRTLLDCALDVHMTLTGTLERSLADQAKDMGVLKHTLSNWKPSWPGEQSFDDAVRNLIEIALEEASRA